MTLVGCVAALMVLLPLLALAWALSCVVQLSGALSDVVGSLLRGVGEGARKGRSVMRFVRCVVALAVLVPLLALAWVSACVIRLVGAVSRALARAVGVGVELSAGGGAS